MGKGLCVCSFAREHQSGELYGKIVREHELFAFGPDDSVVYEVQKNTKSMG
jgi:hypothetical protein